jgi:CheY-like chemotaxis protein
MLAERQLLPSSGKSETKWIESYGFDDVAKTGRSRRILVVEDSVDSAHAMVLLLRSMGHLVEFAVNGYAAVSLANQMLPEFVFLDLRLPGLDGFEVCRRLKAHPRLKGATIISVTGSAQLDYEHRAREAGAEFHFRKPISVDVLESLLK